MVDGESGPDRLHELVKIVAGRVSTLSSMLPSSPLILVRRSAVVKELLQAVYEMYSELLRNRRGEELTLVREISSDSRLC